MADFVTYLLDKGANVNHQNARGDTALCITVRAYVDSSSPGERTQLLGIVRMLIAHHADTLKPDRDKKSVLDVALAHGDSALRNELRFERRP